MSPDDRDNLEALDIDSPTPPPVAGVVGAEKPVAGARTRGSPARIASWFDRLLGRSRPAAHEKDAPSVLEVPPVPAGFHFIEERPLVAGFSLARIIEDDATGERRYEVFEPVFTPWEAELFAFLKTAFIRTLDVNMDDLDRHGAHAYLLDAMKRLLADYGILLESSSKARIRYYLERDFLGFGSIDPLMHDSEIEDISCDGPGTALFLFDRRHESIQTTLTFPDHATLDGFVIELVQRSGRSISVSEPLVDATLPDGSRLQASLSHEITTRGSTFTIRRFREDPFTIVDLMSLGTMTAELLAYFWLTVENGASAIVCGGTASGKTTTLNALSLFIPRADKIVSIEDTREITLTHANWIPSVTRGAVSQESGEVAARGTITMFDLLKAALRQRPEYIVFGEIRGREAYALFQAMATGHNVISTMHADSAESAVYRLESDPINIPRIMLNALDILIIQAQVRVNGKRARRIKEVVEVTGIDPVSGDLLTNRVFAYNAATDTLEYLGHSAILERVREDHGADPDYVARESAQRRAVVEWLARRDVHGVAEVAATTAAYAQRPAAMMERIVRSEAE